MKEETRASQLQAIDRALFSPEYFLDPYPFFHRLRALDPVHRSEPWDCWLVTRYADVSAALCDPRFSSSKMSRFTEDLPPAVRENVRPLILYLSSFMGLSDQPDHTRLRRLVNKAFVPRVIQGMQERIQAIVDDLLDAVQAEGRMDAIRDFAYPLPATVITEMIGLPSDQLEQFKRWSDDIVGFIGAGRASVDKAEAAQESVSALTEYYRPIIEDRRRQPRQDLISALVTAQDQGDQLSEVEMLATSITLLAGGHETTTGLIGNGLLALLQHPTQFRRLQDDPALIPHAIEELLRYDSPVQRAERLTRESVEIDGRTISAGERVLLVVAAANRDPAQFPEPDRLDVGRQENRHVAFGLGIHSCIGSPLARMEGTLAIETILRRFPSLGLEEHELAWQENVALRVLKRLSVRF